MQVCIGTLDQAIFVDKAPVFKGETPRDKDIYFSPAQRARKGGLRKDVLGTIYLWVDCDDPVMPDPTFPASALVASGHGWHLYWKLREPLKDIAAIEFNNKVLISDIPTADKACWNANRLMRVPETWNVGKPGTDETPTQALLKHFNAAVEYDLADFTVLAGISDNIRQLIRTGERGSYASRSERDWAVIRSLIIAGATDTLIFMLFTTMPIGDKFREQTTPDHYLSHSIDKARQELEVEPPTAGEFSDSVSPKDRRKGAQTQPVHIQEKLDGYYMVSTGSRRVSTFVLDPLILLDGSAFKSDDAIVCDVLVDDARTENVTFPKSAFSSVSQMDKSCPNVLWHWLGHDTDVRHLLPFLTDRLKEKGGGNIRKVTASPTLGYHTIGDIPMFLGDKQTITPTRIDDGIKGDITWLPTGKEHPKLNLTTEVSDEQLIMLSRLLPLLNTEATLWTILGWYSASCLKPWLESMNYRFPILNLTGTKGSGKTTISQRIFMPLFGQTDAKGYDAGTTKFVQLALLGSSNAVPIAFSEFRADSVEKFVRTILMAYDTGHDPRGRGDQTTQDYPLSAPFSVDGEDIISDAAAKERVVVARLRPDTIAEGTAAYDAFRELRTKMPAGFAGYFIQRCLIEVITGGAAQLLQEATNEMFAAYPSKLPDRVRNNYTVALFGAKLFSRAVLHLPSPDASVFRASIAEIVSLDSGRSRSLIDEFTETVLLAIKQGGNVPFQWRYDNEAGAAFFQMSGAHDWWIGQRRKQGRSWMERDSIVSQLLEAPYYVTRKNVGGSFMYGVSLEACVTAGLDVSSMMGSTTFTFEL